jgi:serine/threonine protein phosphatase PrpC
MRICQAPSRPSHTQRGHIKAITLTYITPATAGDSAAVLGRRGGTAVRLSVDHRADNATEMLRVIQAGGNVDYDAQGTLRLYKPTDQQRQQGCMFTRCGGWGGQGGES